LQQVANANNSKWTRNMVDTKLAVMRIDVSQETGEVILLVKTGCGFRPVMGWPDVNGLQIFAANLLGICSNVNHRDDEAAGGTYTEMDLKFQDHDDI
jgi:hypothetical protein